MTILITGVAGLIGSNLAHWVLANTEDIVVGVDDLSGGYIENIPELSDRFHFRRFDINNSELLNYNFEHYKPDVVFHFAAYAAECVSPFIRKFNYTNNLLVTAGVINCCIKHKVSRLVFTSSMAVYGNGKAPFDEYDIPNPCDPYGVAKAACEADIRIAGEQHELDWCIIRPHNMYGIRQSLWDSYRNVIGIFMYKALNGEPLTVYGDGEQLRAFSEIQDSLPCLYKAGIAKEASKQIINLGGIKEYSVNSIANIIHGLSGSEIIYLAPRHEVKYAFATYQKSIDILGFEHHTHIVDGIRNMWEWAKDQPKRKRFIWSDYEIKNGLYDYWQPEKLKDGYYKK